MIGATSIDTWRLRGRRGLLAAGAPAFSRPGVTIVRTARAAVRCRVVGEASPGRPSAFLVCDPPGVIEHYDEVLALLGRETRVVAMEPPGFGWSVPERGFDFGFGHYADAFDEVVRALEGEGGALLAFPCIWAHIALRLATERPDAVRSLLLVQAPSWDEQAAWARRVDTPRCLSLPVIGQAASMAAPARIARAWYRAALAKGRHEAFMPELEEALRRGAFCCLGSLWQSWFADAPPPLAGPVAQPALLAWGAADRTHRRSDPRSLAPAFADASWHVFADAGHCPEIETPGAFAALFAHWLRGTPLPTALDPR